MGDAPVSEDGETAALLQHAGTRAQEHMPNCFRPECVENGCDPITPRDCNGNHGYGIGSNCEQTEDQCHNCLSGGLPGVWCADGEPFAALQVLLRHQPLKSTRQKPARQET